MANKSTQKQWKTRVETPLAPSPFFSRLLLSAGRGHKKMDLCRCTAEVWRDLTCAVDRQRSRAGQMGYICHGRSRGSPRRRCSCQAKKRCDLTCRIGHEPHAEVWCQRDQRTQEDDACADPYPEDERIQERFDLRKPAVRVAPLIHNVKIPQEGGVIRNHSLDILAGLIESRFRRKLELQPAILVSINQRSFGNIVVVGLLRVPLGNKTVRADVHGSVRRQVPSQCCD